MKEIRAVFAGYQNFNYYVEKKKIIAPVYGYPHREFSPVASPKTWERALPVLTLLETLDEVSQWLRDHPIAILTLFSNQMEDTLCWRAPGFVQHECPQCGDLKYPEGLSFRFENASSSNQIRQRYPQRDACLRESLLVEFIRTANVPCSERLNLAVGKIDPVMAILHRWQFQQFGLVSCQDCKQLRYTAIAHIVNPFFADVTPCQFSPEAIERRRQAQEARDLRKKRSAEKATARAEQRVIKAELRTNAINPVDPLEQRMLAVSQGTRGAPGTRDDVIVFSEE